MEIVHQHFSIIDSTQEHCKRNFSLFDREKLTVISSDEQTHGHGRDQRAWFSPNSKNIYASFCFFLPKDTKDLINISQLLSISACKIVESEGLKVVLKWPNDLLISNQKLAGVISEFLLINNEFCVIAGIGMNVNMEDPEIKMLSNRATSLKKELKRNIDQKDLFLNLQKEFAKDLDAFKQKGFSIFFEIYYEHIKPFLGKPIFFHERNQMREGIFHSLNPDGSLNLFLPSGKIQKFYAGEIM